MAFTRNLLELPYYTTSTPVITSGNLFRNNNDFSPYSILGTNLSVIDYESNWTATEEQEILESLVDFHVGRHKEFETLEDFLADLHAD
jgi:hypothetical protein